MPGKKTYCQSCNSVRTGNHHEFCIRCVNNKKKSVENKKITPCDEDAEKLSEVIGQIWLSEQIAYHVAAMSSRIGVSRHLIYAKNNLEMATMNYLLIGGVNNSLS